MRPIYCGVPLRGSRQKPCGARPGKLYAIAFDLQSKAEAVLASDDAEKTWTPLGSRTH